MTIAVGALSHETNTLASGTTDLADFEVAADEELLGSFAAGRSIEGVRDELRSADLDLLPTIGAATMPGPTVEASTFEHLRSAMVERMEDRSIDGVCLDLHGSMYADAHPDPEGELLAAIREVVGPDVPITVALDMHATVTETFVHHVDGVAGYRTAPHTDVVETGERAARLLLEALDRQTELVLGWKRLPMLVAGERSETEAEPMRTLIDRCRTVEGRDGILDADYFLGFPWADSPHAGCHALVTGRGSALDTVDEATAELASAFWERRDEFDFTTEAHPPPAALDEAAATDGRPVVVADTGDIPGAGASEDVTDFLAEILEREDLGVPVVAVIADEASYAACATAGEGSSVDLSLGRSAVDGTPLSVTGTVQDRITADGVGSARVDLGGIEVIVTDGRTNRHRDPEYLRDLGVEPTDRDLIVLKSGYLSPAWKDIAARRLFALTPGDTNQVLEEIPYERIPRPIVPLDDDVPVDVNTTVIAGPGGSR